MERSPNHSNLSSTSVAFSEEPKARLGASLRLSILKDMGNRRTFKLVQVHVQVHQFIGRDVLRHTRRPDAAHAGPNPPVVRMVNALIDSIGECSEPFEKQLTTSDIIGIQSRLLVNKADFVKSILPLLKKGDDIELAIPVRTYNPAGKAHPMTFKICCGRSHVITSGWNLFVKENQSEVSDIVRIWAFRDVWTRELCLSISSRRPKAPKPIEKEKRHELEDQGTSS